MRTNLVKYGAALMILLSTVIFMAGEFGVTDRRLEIIAGIIVFGVLIFVFTGLADLFIELFATDKNRRGGNIIYIGKLDRTPLKLPLKERRQYPAKASWQARLGRYIRHHLAHLRERRTANA